MSRKWLAVIMAITAGLFVATSAMADLPEEAEAILSDIVLHNVGNTGSGNTSATILNPEGTGDVLIFPYYDVRQINGKAQDFFFTIINNEDDFCEGVEQTTQCYDGTAAKLRFREWDKSEEVFDVDIWLSRTDVWVGQVTYNTAIALPYGARILSPDFVIINNDVNTFTLGTPLAAGFDFPTTAFIPPGSSNLMGYIEVIGEERTYDTQAANKVSRITVGNGPGLRGTGVADVSNQLMGFAYLVRVSDGQSMAYNAKAIANFNDTDPPNSVYTLFQQPGGTLPQLTQAEDFLESLEFQMSKESIFAAYDIESIINGQTSIIVTFPTKHFHFCPRPNYSAIGIGAGFCVAPPLGQLPTQPWTASEAAPVGVHNANTPEIFSTVIFDRNENRLTPPPCFVSPCPTGTVQGLPYEVNIIGLYQGTPPTVPALGNRNNVTISTGSFDSGWIFIEWANLGFPIGAPAGLDAFFNFGTFYGHASPPAAVAAAGYSGLPLFAMSLQEYSNGAVGGWYGDIRDTWYEVEWLNRAIPVNGLGGPPD